MRSGKIIKRIIQLAPVLMIVLMAVIYFAALKDLTFEQVLNYTPTAPLAAAAVLLLMYALKSLSYFFPMLLIAAVAGAVLPIYAAIPVNLLGIVIMASIPYAVGKYAEGEVVDKLAAKFTPDVKNAEEMAENLAEMGVSVTIVQRPKQLLAPLDADMASFVHAEMRRHGVALRLGETVTGFRQDGDSVLTLLEESEPLHSDMVLLAIGVTPDTHLAKETGLRLGIRGSIAVNERMETSVPDIYAVGDAVEVSHFVTGQKALISLAGPANKQGRIAADNICGGSSRFHGSQGSSVLKLFGLTAASTGINEKAAQAAGIAYDRVVLFPASHAAYYPGAQSMAMKVLYEKESLRLLGAQIVGGDGVDKRIDVLATAIRAKMTALELTELDLSYAPPYSSAKDPVNMAGFMIEDLENGKVRQFHWNEVEDLPCDGSAALLDVRTEGEYRRGHLNGFRNIPLDDLREHLDELERDKPVYVNCQTGLRSYLACRLLTQYGFTCAHLSGGYSFYQVVTQERQTARSAYPCGMEKL